MSLDIEKLSKHLFWEYDIEQIDKDKHRDLVILRVLEYGVDKDWERIKKYYTVEEIKTVAKNARTLDDVALAFVSFYTDTPLSEFRCYTQKQLIPHFSGY